MRYINMETWTRREHFDFFFGFDHPHTGVCANVDLTRFYPFVKQQGFSFTAAMVYLIARASNDIPEFRYRIRDGKVVEHNVVHPAITILVDQDIFGFCTIEYSEDFGDFATRAAENIALLKEDPALKDKPGQDDLLFITAIPWVSFTSFLHPLNLQPPDSVPRFAYGKFFQDGKVLKMPLSVQGHHALMDGIHMGRWYAKIEEYLNQPDAILGNGR